MTKCISVLDDLKDHIYNQMTDQGIDEGTAEIVAARLKEHFRKHWGGQQIYFTVTGGERERNEELYSKYDGTNRDELSREYGITPAYFYKIIKALRASKAEKI